MLAKRNIQGTGEAPRSAASNFPPPPMAVVSGADWIQGGEPVAIRLPSGEKLTGSLVEFRADTGVMRWLPREGGAERKVRLNAVKLVQVIVDGHFRPEGAGEDAPA